LVFLVIVSSFFFSNFDFSGKVTLSLEKNYVPGERIDGSINLGLKQGELLPASTKLFINNSGEIHEYFLSELVSFDLISGNFYVENINISGSGEGYGLVGEKKIYPFVDFVLEVSGESTGNETAEEG